MGRREETWRYGNITFFDLLFACRALRAAVDFVLSLTRAELDGMLQRAGYPAMIAATVHRALSRAAAKVGTPLATATATTSDPPAADATTAAWTSAPDANTVAFLIDEVEVVGGASRTPLMQSALLDALDASPAAAPRPGAPVPPSEDNSNAPATPTSTPTAPVKPASVHKLPLWHQLNATESVAWGCAYLAAQLLRNKEAGAAAMPPALLGVTGANSPSAASPLHVCEIQGAQHFLTGLSFFPSFWIVLMCYPCSANIPCPRIMSLAGRSTSASYRPSTCCSALPAVTAVLRSAPQVPPLEQSLHRLHLAPPSRS